MKSSIVIPTYNRAYFLGECLEALLKQDYPNDEYELLVVDDGSIDQTKQIVSDYASRSIGIPIRYLYQKNKGPAAARNMGWQHAQGGLIAFIDDDCLASPRWLGEITSGYDNPDIAGICGNVLPVELDNLITNFLTVEKLHQNPFYDNHGQIIYPITCNASFRRDILEKVGGFDESFPHPGGEDVDLGIRIRKLGYFFQDNRNAIIYHYHKDSLTGMLKTWYRYGIGGAQWQLKNKCSLYHRPDERGNIRWMIKYPESIRPVKALIWQLLRIANIPREIHRYRKKGIDLWMSVIYCNLDYLRNSTYHIGQLIGYCRYRSLM